MKRFIIKTFLLVSPIIVICIFIEYSLRKIPNNYTYKKNYLDNHSSEIQMLIFGSSYSYFGINPEYISQNAFNVGMVTQSLYWDWKIFEKYQNQLEKLNIIILPIAYQSFWYTLEDQPEFWRVKNYKLYWEINPNSFRIYSELLTNPFWISLDRLFKYFFEKTNEISCNSFGWGMIYRSENAANLNETGKNTAKRYTVDMFSDKYIKLFNENLEVINSFSEFCSKRNISLVLLVPPTYYTFRENIDQSQLNKMMKTMNDFVKDHSHCYLLSWFDNSDFVEKDFYDADHLNEIGTEKFSLMVYEKLKEINLIK